VYIATLFGRAPDMLASVAKFSAQCEAQVYGDTCTESYFSDGMTSFNDAAGTGALGPGGGGICDVGSATGAGFGRFD
jgi:hypothetical protein